MSKTALPKAHFSNTFQINITILHDWSCKCYLFAQIASKKRIFQAGPANVHAHLTMLFLWEPAALAQ